MRRAATAHASSDRASLLLSHERNAPCRSQRRSYEGIGSDKCTTVSVFWCLITRAVACNLQHAEQLSQQIFVLMK